MKQADALAARGFFVFPLVANSKLPAVKEWQNAATVNPADLHWPKNANVGVFAGKFMRDGELKALLIVDEDNKAGKDGAGTDDKGNQRHANDERPETQP